MNLLKNIFLVFLVFSINQRQAGAFEPSEHDVQQRERLKTLITEPGFFDKGLTGMAALLSSLTPRYAKWVADWAGSSMVATLHGLSPVRHLIEKTAFAKDNQRFSAYDEYFGVFKQIPEDAVDTQLIDGLLERAREERAKWQHGQMSGAIYDGSEEHMQALADYFIEAVLKDGANQHFFVDDEAAIYLAKKAFHYFNTANPLHGTSFALAVKAMRELGTMFATMLGKEHAIVSSGGQEALRIGLRALKNNGPEGDYLLFDDEGKYIHRAMKTLNLTPYPLKMDSDEYEYFTSIAFAAVYLTENNINNLKKLNQIAMSKKWRLHIHLSKSLFRNLFAKDPFLTTLFQRFRAIASISFDSDGIIYGGISATVFSNATARFFALESHIDWIGGMYPGINSAGSIAGIDYILAYLMVLHKGRKQLLEIPKASPLYQRGNPLSIGDVLSQFRDSQDDFNLNRRLEGMRAELTPDGWRDFLEKSLVELNLSLFKASPERFDGHITSGGTESIRLAVQAYYEAFKKREQPIFLMTEAAHVAFERHIKDIDAKVVRIGMNADSLGMNVDDLQIKIAEYGADNISAIIASTPSYPFGAYDDIKSIAAIAKENKIPLHIDSCLGGYLMQFIPGNPLALNFASEHFDGVTSWSADLHKYGVTQKGLSFVGFAKSFTKGMQLTHIAHPRSATQLEVGLACLLAIGEAGYQERAMNIAALGKRLSEELSHFAAIELRALPVDPALPHFVVAFSLKEPLKPLTYSLAGLMKELGWHLSQVGEHSLHIALTNAHVYNDQFVPKFISDLSLVIEHLKRHPELKKSSSVGVYGMAADFNITSSDGYTTATLLNAFVKFYAENLLNVD